MKIVERLENMIKIHYMKKLNNGTVFKDMHKRIWKVTDNLLKKIKNDKICPKLKSKW